MISSSSSNKRLYYHERKTSLRRRYRYWGMIILICIIYVICNSLFITSWSLDSQSMEPTIQSGTRMLVRPLLMDARETFFQKELRRGDVVTIYPPFIPPESWYFKVFGPFVRFFTFQQIKPGRYFQKEWETRRVFKRIIALPGDTVRIQDSIAFVKKAGDDYFVNEFEQSGISYDVIRQQLPQDWPGEYPLGKNRSEIVLGADQYFVMSDNRNSSNDSRYWGAVDKAAIKGRVLAVYWPLSDFGRLH